MNNPIQINLFSQMPASSWIDLTFLSLDTETTGLNSKECRIIEVGAVKFQKQAIINETGFLCKIPENIPQKITEISGITNEMIQNEKPFAEYADWLINEIKSVDFVVAYNAEFDKGFIKEELVRIKKALPDVVWIDPMVFIKEVDKFKKGKKLADAAARWNIKLAQAHRALDDAKACGELLCKLAPKLQTKSLADTLTKQNLWFKEQEKSFREYLMSKER
jgi:DNA polymerase III epsilon subunit family exonuclease